MLFFGLERHGLVPLRLVRGLNMTELRRPSDLKYLPDRIRQIAERSLNRGHYFAPQTSATAVLKEVVGLPADEAAYVGFISDQPVAAQGRSRLGRVRCAGILTPGIWLERIRESDGSLLLTVVVLVTVPGNKVPQPTDGLTLMSDEGRASYIASVQANPANPDPRLTHGEFYIVDWPQPLAPARYQVNRFLDYETLHAMKPILVACGIDCSLLPDPWTEGPHYCVSLRPGEKQGRPVIEGQVQIGYFASKSDARAWLKQKGTLESDVALFDLATPSRRFGRSATMIDEDDAGRLVKRSRRKEQRLLANPLPITHKKRSGTFTLGARGIAQFLDEGVPALTERKAVLRVDPTIREMVVRPLRPVLNVQGSGIDWFASVHVDGLSAEESAELAQAETDADGIIVLSTGRWLRADVHALSALRNSLASLGLRLRKDGTTAPFSRGTWAALLLDLELGTERRTEALLSRLSAGASQERHPGLQGKPPDTFVADLRPYQLEGYLFLERLHLAGLGGLLADDMGLGKTVQGLSFLAALHSGSTTRSPALMLVIAPVAALSVWESEARRFAPNLPVRVYHGQQRKDTGLPASGLVLTTYATLLRDIEHLKEVPFETALLDEAQSLKNHMSESARAVRSLRCKSIFALTGTPLENHLGDVWSLMDLVFPGLLGNRKSFLAAFGKGDAASMELLKGRLAPFVLRRLKSEVMKELPPLTETNVAVPMSDDQARLYEAVRKEAIAALDGAGHNYLFTMLPYLMRLRRIACHPHLERDRADPLASGKFRHFADIAEELAASSSGVLVFSQFTDVLSKVGELLHTLGLKFHRLDGSTAAQQRKQMTEAFQAGEHPFFLISLKAGGTALTLHRADTVVHLDPWWNPMVERQATDRTHRIGQTRPVMVYRLYATGTVEEKVLQLQEKKRELFQSLFGDEMHAEQAMSREEIRDLLG